MIKCNLFQFGRKQDDAADGLTTMDAAYIEQLKADFAAQLSAAHAETEQLRGQTQDNLSHTQDTVVNAVVSPEAYLEERVPVTLFKDNDRYKDDVVLGLNAEIVVIARGMPVYIKRKFMHILENHFRQQLVAADMQQQLAAEAFGRAKMLDI